MMERAVVGAIDVGGGLHALAEAQALGVRELALVTVSRRAHDGDRRWALLREIRSRAGVDAELHVVKDRHPGRGLVEAARTLGADVLVLSAPRPGQLHPLRGEATRTALYHTPCPIVIARGAPAGRPARTVAVGFDGSPSSRAAVAVAAELAGAQHAALTVVAAWSVVVLPPAAGVPPTMAEDEARRVRNEVDELLTELPSRTASRVVHGTAVAELLTIAENVDLLVVGTGDCTVARRVLSGSTADAVMHRADCPVMVVPTPAALSGEAVAADDEPAAAEA